MEKTIEPVKDASRLYEVERRAEHAARPGFRITELQISKKQKVPWHYHSNVQDTFYVLKGDLRIFLREPIQRQAHFFLVHLGFRLYRDVNHRFRKFHLLQHDDLVGIA